MSKTISKVDKLGPNEVLQAIQSRTARIAVGPSTVRGRGNAGVVAAARKFLRQLDLRSFSDADEASFSKALNAATEALRAELPRGAKHWGIARKVLNIFLRDCLYNSYLDEVFNLRQHETLFEIPLDSITAGHLKRAAGRGKLPAWRGVKYLTPIVSAQFQDFAAAQAVAKGIARIHLDAIWWSVSRDNDAV